MNIRGIDYRAALRVVGGNEELLEQVLDTFYQLTDSKAALIEQYAASGDLYNYTIEIHALKSASKSIGALDLAEYAYVLEREGQKNNIDRIQAETEMLTEEYRTLGLEIKKYLDGRNLDA